MVEHHSTMNGVMAIGQNQFSAQYIHRGPNALSLRKIFLFLFLFLKSQKNDQTQYLRITL